MSSGFTVATVDRVAVLTIDRPKANALDAATSVAMGEAFVGFEQDDAVRVSIITGAGSRFFCAGWDLAAAGDGESFDAYWGVGGFGGFCDLAPRTKPVIAAVNGMAVGGGFEIAMAADMIVAAEHAEFFLPEAAIGVLPDAASVRLPKLLPPHIAREMLLTGRRMGAVEAQQRGLANHVVPESNLLAAALQLAQQVVAAAPLSVAAILDIGRRSEFMDAANALEAMKEYASYRAAIDSRDAEEGRHAFEERRPPQWRGE